MRLPGRFLVKGVDRTVSDYDGDNATAYPSVVPLLLSDVSLSFWGGIDPITGIVIDATHPLAGKSVVDTILCIPSGRGSCTASQVLLELILNDKAPKALVLRDVDGLACVGALVAQEILRCPTLDIIHVGEDVYRELLESGAAYGSVLSNGQLVIGDKDELVRSEAQQAAVEPSDPATLPVESTDAEKLSEEEESLLQNCRGEAERMALHVIFRYARLSSNTPSYLPVAKAHIDGCTYIGPGGLDFVQRLVKAGGQVRVPTTLNSVSTDRRRWQALGVPADYANNAIALGDAYLELQCQPSFTCAPYLLTNAPELGQDLVWGESNAVVYANSVLGARTEKYADYLDICCAIAGIVPAMGVHLDANRRPTVVLDATEVISVVREHLGTDSGSDWDILFPTLGHLCGTLADGKVPILVGLEDVADQVTLDALKAFCAAYGTTGSSPLIHIAGITPEAKDPAVIQGFLASCGGSVRTLSMGQLEDTFRTLDSDAGVDHTVDMVALGNPHLSLSECQHLVELVENEAAKDSSFSQKDPNVRIIACISRALHSEAQALGHIKRLEDFGIEFINDTCWCMLLDPPVIPVNPNARILTNSGKYAHYGPGLTQRSFRFGSMADCVRAAATGVYDKQPVHTGENVMPSWLAGNRTQASQRRSFTVNAMQSLRPFLKMCRR